jgi:hypothetical protein
MSSFFQEVWHDLREKRLWPVAALLTLAVLTVPFVLKKSPSETSASTTPPPASPAKAGLPAVLPGGNEVTGSALSVFTAGDPFTPKVKPKKDTLASTPSPSGLGTGTGGSAGSAPTLGGGGSTGGTTPTTPPSSGGQKTTFAYVLDLHFGAVGHLKKIKGLEKLQMLPSSDSPLLVFLGATSGGDDAVFLLDSTLKQAGEGHCADTACSLLSIGAGSEHHFVDQSGKEYVLRIDQIRKVRLGSHSARSSAVHDVRTAVGQTVHTAATQTAATTQVAQDSTAQAEQRARAFVSALLVDVETVASTNAGP